MMVDDECDSIMGDIIVEAGPDPVEDDTHICTVLHPENEEDNEKSDD